jgi:hypothetical protein
LNKSGARIFSVFRNSDSLAGAFRRSEDPRLLETGFFMQVRELKIQRKNLGSALCLGRGPHVQVQLSAQVVMFSIIFHFYSRARTKDKSFPAKLGSGNNFGNYVPMGVAQGYGGCRNLFQYIRLGNQNLNTFRNQKVPASKQ